MSLMLDLRIVHDRFGSRSDPSINGHLHYPNDIDRSLNETVTDKIRKYLTDYNNNPPDSISFMSVIVNTSGRLHSDDQKVLEGQYITTETLYKTYIRETNDVVKLPTRQMSPCHQKNQKLSGTSRMFRGASALESEFKKD